jgi:hypothetical protein
MHGELEREGNYELFETNHGHQILELNNKVWFAIIKGKYGDILVKSDSDHVKSKVLKKGRFYLADFNDDPSFKDMPHLFLEDGNKYREWILPNYEATEGDFQKKLVKTGDLVSKEKVKDHVKGSGKVGNEKKYKGTDRYSKNRKPVNKEGRSDFKKAEKSKNKLAGKSTKELFGLAKKKTFRTIKNE